MRPAQSGVTTPIDEAPRPPYCSDRYCGVEQLAARRAHNPEVAGSSPAPASDVSAEVIRTYDYPATCWSGCSQEVERIF